MRVLIGCEQFGHMREAFRRRGHDAWSCDLKPARDGSPYHLQGDVLLFLDGLPVATLMGWKVIPWDLAIFHPDCTYFTNSAEWAYKDPDYDRYPGVGYHQRVKPETLVGAARRAARQRDADFVRKLRDCRIPRKAIENPRGYLSRVLGPPSQTVQPFEFGDDASKATCFWLYGLLPLKADSSRHVQPRMVNGRPRWANQTDGGQNKLTPGEDRAMQRAATYPGIAEACAAQWGDGMERWTRGTEISVEADRGIIRATAE